MKLPFPDVLTVFFYVQYFSRTDRLLKHKRTCGDVGRKGPDGEELQEHGSEVEGGRGSYAITQGSGGRKRGKSKMGGEGGRRRKAVSSHGQATQAYAQHDFSTVDHRGLALTSSSEVRPGPCMHAEAESKMAFKRGQRKGAGKSGGSKPDGMLTANSALDDLSLLQSNKPEQSSSNYDDAMQFIKKRRYLQAGNNATGYDVGVSHVPSPPVVVQGALSASMDADASLGLLDSSGLADIKPDKLTIPDEVLHSLLEHYGYKSDMGFDLAHMELEPGAAEGPDSLGTDANPGGVERSSIMQEYSRFLLQALERTSHSGGFVLGPAPPPAVSTSSPSTVASFPSYTDFSFAIPPPSSSSPNLGSSLQGFHHLPSNLDHTGSQSQHSQHSHQQLTPSQELTEQLGKTHASPPAPSHTPNPNAYQILVPPPDPSGQKNGHVQKNAHVEFSVIPSKNSYQIENFAQAFGGQFKAGRRPLGFGTDSGVDVEHFSGYSSLLADGSDAKSPASQSYD